MDGGVTSWGSIRIPQDLTGVVSVAADTYGETIAVLMADGSVRALTQSIAGLPLEESLRVTGIAARSGKILMIVDGSDCDKDGVRDSRQILQGALDRNGDGVLDGCQSFGADIDDSGWIDFGDVSLAMIEFGDCLGCRADQDGNGFVDLGDIALILLSFGPAS